MPHQVTVTGKLGPNRDATATVVQNVTRIDLDMNDKVMQVYQDTSSYKEFDFGPATTLTCTITAGNFAFVIS